LRIKDVAKVELGAFNYGTKNIAMGKGRCSGVFQTSGSNAQDITTEIMSILEESKPDFPSGIDYIIPYNSKTFLDASINKVIYTLIEAFLLVFLVVYLFLQDFKSTLIPAIAVPVDHRNFSSCKYLVSRSTC
jgi:HAE1 family hydrophobic/amphiphilic exporter-1